MSVSGDSFIADDSDDDEDAQSEDEKPKRKATGKASATTTPSNSGRKSIPRPPANKKTTTKPTSSSGNKNEPKYALIYDTPSKCSTPNIVTPNMRNNNNSDEEVSTPMTGTPHSVFQLPEGVVGQGSHEHNSFDFLKPENRRDTNNNKMDSPDYNPRTVKVPAKFLNDQTPAMQQWWTYKSQNMDTVLFFKVGKFYELFHMDADVAFSELDLIYMKGNKAHSGFPEVSYGKFASALVCKGYRVARIEQTETPDQLKERNDSMAKKGQKKDKVVLRELCAIMTKGTRTYCHLDDLSLLDEMGNDSLTTSLLICIKETPIDQSSVVEGQEGEEHVAEADHDTAVTEYGITCIDTVIGKVTLAQFQDNKQRTRFRSFLIKYLGTEILLENNGFSEETMGVIKLLCPKATVEILRGNEMPSTGTETLFQLYKAQYFPNKQPKSQEEGGNINKKLSLSQENLEEIISQTKNWPDVLSVSIKGLKDGSSNLMMCSLGGALWQLKRSLIDYEVLSMGKIYAYIPTDEYSSSSVVEHEGNPLEMDSSSSSAPMDVVDSSSTNGLTEIMQRKEENEMNFQTTLSPKRMILDEIALTNLEVLVNNYDRTETGSMWSFINRCKTLSGKRLLRTWLCHPLYHVEDIQRRTTAVEEFLSNDGLKSVMEDCKRKLKSLPDLERLLSRIHSNGLKRSSNNASDHPDTRAVMFEASIYTSRKIKDFADILTGYEVICSIMNLFQKLPIQSNMLKKALKQTSSASSNLYDGFPLAEIKASLDYFRTIFDEKQAKKDGNIKPKEGINPDYDVAMANIEEIKREFDVYLKEMKKTTGINDISYFGNGKDRYQLEVPIGMSSKVPHNWNSKSQKKTHRRYWTKFIEDKLSELQQQEEVALVAQKDTLRNIFEKFDSSRPIYERAVSSIALLDALLSLVTISSLPGYVWPNVVRKEQVGGVPMIEIKGGRHPMLEYTLQQK
jgi:DNA mismatch repair protein MSH6